MILPAPELLALIEYRMHAVAIGHLALRYTSAWEEVPAVQIYFDGEQVIEGKATAFTNSAIEAAIVHCRALLEFLGLGGKSQTELVERSARSRTDDQGVEHFGDLKKVSIDAAVRPYPGSRHEAEGALAYVIYLANKGLAHTTSSFTMHDQGSHLLEIAFRGVPVLMVNNFYVPLGIRPPEYKVSGRKRAV
ncbi:MAG: hypothetical protein ABIP61_12595 [Burkholderiaceae bacterium]